MSHEEKSHTLKTIAPTGEPYVDNCFHIAFQEFEETRIWQEIPEASAIVAAYRNKKIEEAFQLANALRDKYSDFHFSYLWLAALYGEQNRYSEALASLVEGLHVAKSKYGLCSEMGMTLFSTRKAGSNQAIKKTLCNTTQHYSFERYVVNEEK